MLQVLPGGQGHLSLAHDRPLPSTTAASRCTSLVLQLLRLLLLDLLLLLLLICVATCGATPVLQQSRYDYRRTLLLQTDNVCYRS